MITHYVGPREKLAIDMPVQLVIERQRGFARVRFGPAS